MKFLFALLTAAALSSSAFAQSYYDHYRDSFVNSEIPTEDDFQSTEIWSGYCAGSYQTNRYFESWLVVDVVTHPVFGERAYTLAFNPGDTRRLGNTVNLGRRIVRASNGAMLANTLDEDAQSIVAVVERHHNEVVGGTMCNQTTYIRGYARTTDDGEVVEGYSTYREPGANCHITNTVACVYTNLLYRAQVEDEESIAEPTESIVGAIQAHLN